MEVQSWKNKNKNTMEDVLQTITELSNSYTNHFPNSYHRFTPYALHHPTQPQLQPAPIYYHPPKNVILESTQPVSPANWQFGTTIANLYPEILCMIFSKLNVKDRGNAARVCVAWREASYTKSVWKNVVAKLHLRKTSMSSSMFSALVQRGIKQVQVLSLRRSLKEVVISIPNLESLNLSGCYNLSDVNLTHAFATELPNLKTLDLSLCKQITDSSLGRIAHTTKNLEVLELGGCCNFTNTGLLLISWGLKKLKVLNLRSCWHVSDLGIGHIAGMSKETAEGNLQLEHLGLQDLQRLSDESLRYISEGLKSLKSVNLSFCVSVSDNGLKSLSSMFELKKINLRSCDNISDIGLSYLSEGACNITELDVSFCDRITDQGLSHLSQGLFHLQTLSLSACRITDDGLYKIAQSLQDLQILNIGQCNISDKGLKSIAEQLVNLNEIDLYGCGVTQEGLELLEKLPKLKSINLGLWHMKQ
jgi:F-box and leucine-rich repeat protein 14